MGIKNPKILKGVNDKNLGSWKDLYDSYYASLCSYANGILKDADTSQDVVQETLIKIWHSSQQFSTMKDLTWYLCKSVYNNSLYYLRTRNIHENAIRRLETVEAEMPEEQFIHTVQEELFRQLYWYIGQMPEERKKVLLLTIQGESVSRISDLLGISVNTVKTQKARGIKYLREMLKNSVLLFLF